MGNGPRALTVGTAGAPVSPSAPSRFVCAPRFPACETPPVTQDPQPRFPCWVPTAALVQDAGTDPSRTPQAAAVAPPASGRAGHVPREIVTRAFLPGPGEGCGRRLPH